MNELGTWQESIIASYKEKQTTDAISREKAREVVCGLCRWSGTSNCDECEHPIDDIPAADVRPVVLCGECKHWFENGTDYCSCDRDALLRERDFFCAAGEKREES